MPIVRNKTRSFKPEGLLNQSQQVHHQVREESVVAGTPRLEDFVISADVYEYPVEDNVPAGYYLSEIKTLTPRLKNGRLMLDVGYEICSRDGDVYYIKQTYPQESDALRKLYRALVAAGVKPGPNMRDAIGVREVIVLAYVSEKSDFGSIIRRVPKATEDPNCEDADDDFEAD